VKRPLYLTGGIVSTVLGVIGIFLPIMPTVPFLILAAFCFARSDPALEARILNHPVYGPPIRTWREKGAVSRRGKVAATFAFSASIVFGFFTLSGHWLYIPPTIAVVCLSWLWTRPEE
jgi:uncharacterized membrane protein YbaN (DUF454 family)